MTILATIVNKDSFESFIHLHAPSQVCLLATMPTRHSALTVSISVRSRWRFQMLYLSPGAGAVEKKKEIMLGNQLIALHQLCKSLSQLTKISEMSEIHPTIQWPFGSRQYSVLAPPCTLHSKQRPMKLKFCPTLRGMQFNNQLTNGLKS